MKLFQLCLSACLLCLMFACSDPCDDVNCGPGTCNEGTCECPEGFSGVNCEIEDLCFDSMCENGLCNPDTGACDCNEGYEGVNCDTLVLDKFIGSWQSDDFQCAGAANPALFVFEQGIDVIDLQFYISDDPDIIVSVNYLGNDISIPSQLIDNGELTVSGSGTLIDSETIELSLTVIEEYDGTEIKCSGQLIKQ